MSAGDSEVCEQGWNILYVVVLHDIPVLKMYHETQLLKTVRFHILLVPVL